MEIVSVSLERVSQRGKIVAHTNRAAGRVREHPTGLRLSSGYSIGRNPGHMMPRSARASSRTPSTGTSVYRYYDRYGVLIYVGITDRGITRNFEHNTNAPWWQYAVRQEIEHYSTRVEAERREKALIFEFRPPFNTQHNPDSGDLRSQYVAWESSGAPERDPVDLANGLGRRLPMTAMGIGSKDRFVLRTLPEHASIANRLVDFGGAPVLAPKLIGRVSEVHRRGSHAILLVRCKGTLDGLPPLDVAVGLAPLRFASTKPVSFRVPQVDLRFLGTRSHARVISIARGDGA